MSRKRKRADHMTRLPHGSASTYGNHHCRCAACRRAHADACAARRARRIAEGLADDDPRHGKASTSANHGCKCDACTEARNVARREKWGGREMTCVECGATVTTTDPDSRYCNAPSCRRAANVRSHDPATGRFSSEPRPSARP